MVLALSNLSQFFYLLSSSCYPMMSFNTPRRDVGGMIHPGAPWVRCRSGPGPIGPHSHQMQKFSVAEVCG